MISLWLTGKGGIYGSTHLIPACTQHSADTQETPNLHELGTYVPGLLRTEVRNYTWRIQSLTMGQGRLHGL